MALAVRMYLQDFDETYFPYRQNTSGATAYTDGAANFPSCVTECYPATHFWNQIIEPYTKNYGIFSCPSAKQNKVNKLNATTGVYGGTESYGMNHFMNNTNSATKGMSDVAVAEPARTLLIMDERYYHCGPSFRDRTGTKVATGKLKGDSQQYDWGANGYTDQWVDNAAGCNVASVSNAAGMTACMDQQKTLHAGQVNIVWCDGHAKNMQIEKVNYDLIDNPTNSIWDPYKQGYNP